MKKIDLSFIFLKSGLTPILGGLVIFLIISCDAKPPKESYAAQIERGKSLFSQYCVGCHGEDATGLTIDSLEIQPSDLTLLKMENGGYEFPTNDVAVMIDGRQWVAAHGSRAMPVWGDVFNSDQDPEEKEFKGKLGELIAYLMSIQKGKG